MLRVTFLCSQLISEIFALRPEPFEAALEVDSPVDSPEGVPCDTGDTCQLRPLAQHDGEFLLPLHRGSAVPLENAFFSTSSRCEDSADAASGPGISLVPHFDFEDPVNESQILVSIDPAQLALQRKGQDVHLCTLSGSSRCLCRLEESRPVSNGQIFRLILQRLPWEAFGDKAKETHRKLLTLPYDCPGWFRIDVPVVLMIFLCLGLLAAIAHGIFGIWAARKLRQAAGEMDAGHEDGNKVANIPSPTADLIAGALQSLRMVTLMTSLQAVVLRQIRTDAPEAVVLSVILWPCVFGFIGLWRSFRTMCQVQLAHAALQQGICLTQPASSRFYDMFTVLGTVILALCVAIALLEQGLYRCFVIIFTLFLGPSLSISSEIQKANAQDASLGETEGTYRLKGLLRLFRDTPSSQAVPMAEFDVKLKEGKVKMIPFGRFISEGRSSSVQLSELQEGDSDGSSAAGATFNLLLDLPWQSRALFEMSGSFSGFFTIPLIFLAAAVLLMCSMVQAGGYLCATPALADLSLANGGLSFHPWVREYEVKLDSSFSSAFLVASAEATSTVQSLNASDASDVSPSPRLNNTVYGTVGLTSMRVPRVTNVTVNGLQKKDAQYSVLFTPLATLPSSVRLSSKDGFARCVPWGEVPGSVITLPRRFEMENLTLEIALTDYALNIPEACRSNQTFGMAYTEFCSHEKLHHHHGSSLCNGSTLCKDVCKDECSHDPHCLASFVAENGCYKAQRRLHRSSVCADFDQEAHGRRWLQRDVQLTGQLCSATGQSASCRKAEVTEGWQLHFVDVQPEWLNGLAELTMALALAVGDQEFDSNTGILQLGLKPQVTAVLVDLVGVTWKGESVPLNATATAPDDGVVEIVLKQYKPQHFQNMTMHVSILLSDGQFLASWSQTRGVHVLQAHEAANITFKQCDRSLFLSSRFQLCGNPQGWPSQVARISLLPWRPETQKLYFDLLPADTASASGFKGEVTSGTAHITFEKGESPALWAAPEPSSDRRCVFEAFDADANLSHHQSEDLNTVIQEARKALRTSPDALCKFITNKCMDVTAPKEFWGKTEEEEEPVERIISSLQLDPIMTWSQSSTLLASIFPCAREARRPLPWVWGTNASWIISTSWEPRDVFGFDDDGFVEEATHHIYNLPPDAFLIKYNYTMSIPNYLGSGGSRDVVEERTLALRMRDLFFAISTTRRASIDEHLIEEICSFLLEPTHRETKMAQIAAEKEIVAGAWDTNNPEVVSLAMKHCIKDDLWGSEFQVFASLAWTLFTTKSKGVEMLNASLHSLEASNAVNMLGYAAKPGCDGCMDLVQQLVQADGFGPPLVFKELKLDPRDFHSLLTINTSSPWVCATEFILSGCLKNSMLLKTILHQFELCNETPLASLNIGYILASNFDEVIATLAPALPKELHLKLSLDKPANLSNAFRLLARTPRLQTLDLNLNVKTRAHDMSQLSIVCEAIIEANFRKLKDLKGISYSHSYYSGRPPRLTDMNTFATMISMQSNLERLSLKKVGVEDEGFSIFSSVLTEKAPTLKLKSIDLSSSKMGDAGAKAVAGVLALAPSLEKISVTYNWRISDEGAVELLRPLLHGNSSSLKEVDLGSTGVGDAGAETLAKLLEKHPLEKIDISGSKVTDAGLMAMSETLRRIDQCHLTTVWATGLEATAMEAGVASLLGGLRHCPHLVKVEAKGVPMSKQKLRIVLDTLPSWRNLTDLWVTFERENINLKKTNPLK